jgi:hypothetical protein
MIRIVWLLSNVFGHEGAAAAPLPRGELGVSKGKRKMSKLVCRYGVGAPERNNLCAVFACAREGQSPLEDRRGSATTGASAIETHRAETVPEFSRTLRAGLT